MYFVFALHSPTLFCFVLFFRLIGFKRQNVREKEMCCSLIHSPNGYNRSGQARAGSQGLHLGLSHGWQGPTSLAVFCCLSRCISRKMDQMWSSWDLNQYGMYALEAVVNLLHYSSGPLHRFLNSTLPSCFSRAWFLKVGCCHIFSTS